MASVDWQGLRLAVGLSTHGSVLSSCRAGSQPRAKDKSKDGVVSRDRNGEEEGEKKRREKSIACQLTKGTGIDSSFKRCTRSRHAGEEGPQIGETCGEMF